MIIGTRSFKGIIPKIAPQLLGDTDAQDASNCNLKYGDLRPFDNYSNVADLIDAQTYLTLYRYLSTHWFAWEADVDIVSSPIADDADNRRYYTGDGIPKKTNETEATTGSGDKPINFYPLAVPTPLAALTATPTGSGGSGDDRDVVYVWTIRDAWGEEGKPSPASSVVTARSGETVNLSNITIEWKASTAYEQDQWVVPTVLGDYVYKCVTAGTTGSSEPTWGTDIDEDTTDGAVEWRCYKKDILFTGYAEKRIYRALTGDVTASYKRVTTIAMGTETFADSVTDETLAIASTLTTSDYDPPPDDLISIFSMGSFNVGIRSASKEVCFSEPNFPYAWPIKYRLNTDDTAVAVGGRGSTIIVATDGSPMVITGSTPSTMTPRRFPEVRPCLSKRGFVMFSQGAAWPTSRGLYFNDGASGRIITELSINRDEWEEYDPDSMQSMEYEGSYLAFYDDGAGSSGALMIDLVDGIIMPLTVFTTAAFVDEKEGALYYVNKNISDENDVYRWEGDDTQAYSNFAWESKDYVLPANVGINTGRVEFVEGDLATFWDLFQEYQEDLVKNTVKLAAFDIGSIDPVGGWQIGVWGPGQDDLLPLGSPPAYEGDLELTLKIYSDGVLRLSIPLYHTDIFKFNAGKRRSIWKYRIEGNVQRVKSILLASSSREIKAARNGG